MNRITKIFSVIIIAVCTLSFAACAGGNLPDNTAVITQNSTPSPTLNPTEAPNINAILPDSKAFNDVPIDAQKWIDKAQNSSAVLMSQAEIQAMNMLLSYDSNTHKVGIKKQFGIAAKEDAVGDNYTGLYIGLLS